MSAQCDIILSHAYMKWHNWALGCVRFQLHLNYKLSKSKKIRNHYLQVYVANKDVQLRVETKISTRFKVKRNKSEAYITNIIKKYI